MKLEGNTILITGGGSGIGKGLAEALHARGNQVIIAGRRKANLDETTAANPGMKSIVLDIEDPENIKQVAAQVVAENPALNVLMNNAGIMRVDTLTAGIDEKNLVATITTNLLGPIRLTAALIEHLKAQSHATVINVTSGLAFVPLAPTAVYSATKAALHSFTESLRYQLQKTSVEVLELIPPYVQTELLNGKDDPRAMPLADYIAESMKLLETATTEICVERVMPLRGAAASGKYEQVHKGMNDAMSASMH